MADKAQPIPYWGIFGSPGYFFDYDPSTTAAGQQFLQGIRQYDPGAQFVMHNIGGEGGGQNVYEFQYDPSKVPGRTIGGGNVDLNAHDYAPLYVSNLDSETIGDYLQKHPDGGNFQGQLVDPNLVTNDPVWGRVTPQSNVHYNDRSMLDILGPLAVLTFGFGAPLLASAMSNGAIGGAAAASGASGAAVGGSSLDGSLMPMMPIDESSLYTPMLPFNALDPSLAIDGITPAAAAGGGAALSGGALSDAPLQPMIPQDPSSLYEPMLPFNPQDPSLALSGGGFWSTLAHDAGRVASALSSSGALGHGALGGGGGGMGGGGGGLLGAGSPVEDASTILARFYGLQKLNPLLDPRGKL